jgi:ketosteroid isomerase-like protein
MMKRTIFCFLLLLTSSALSFGQSTGLEKEIAELDGELFEAVWKADAAVRDRIVAEDFIYITYAGETLTKSDWVATVKNPAGPNDTFKVSDVKVRVYGDMAIATGHVAVVYRQKDRTGLGELRYTNVYVKRQGDWKAVSGQATPINKHLWKREVASKDALKSGE